MCEWFDAFENLERTKMKQLDDWRVLVDYLKARGYTIRG